jgi:hypothetical protein
MKKTTILLFAVLLCSSVILKSQTLKDSDSIIENATYPKEDLTNLLRSNIRYPLEALKNNLQGDVILSFRIDKNGKLDSLKMKSSPDITLSTSSIVSLNHVEDEWSPCKVNGKPIDKEYLMVFRYRLYKDTQPPVYKKKAAKLIEKQKHEKALQCLNEAISENRFDYELFETRSKVKNALGDKIGATEDLAQSGRLKNTIISLIDVVAIGVTRVERRISGDPILLPPGAVPMNRVR